MDILKINIRSLGLILIRFFQVQGLVRIIVSTLMMVFNMDSKFIKKIKVMIVM
jgi:hypothetical protein